MVVQVLRLRNFRSYKATDVLFGAKNIVLGRNGSGKSTLVDAVCWALDGTCRGTDDGGRGAEVLRHRFWEPRDPASRENAGVEVQTPDGVFRRGLGDGPQSQVGKMIRETVRARREAVRAIFCPGTFLSLPVSEQAALVSALCAPPDIAPVAGEHLRDLVPEPEVPHTVGDLDSLDRKMRAERPKLKRLIEEAERGAAFDLSSFPEGMRGLSLEDLAREEADARLLIAELSKQRDGLLVREQPRAPRKPPAQARRPGESEESHRLRREVAEARDKVAQLRAEPLRCPLCHCSVLYVTAAVGVLPEGPKLVERDRAGVIAEVLETAISSAEARLAAPTAEPEPVQEALPEPERAEASPERQALDERLANGRRILSDLGRLTLVRQQQAKGEERVRLLRKTLADVERAVEVMAPKGPLRAALAEAGRGQGYDLSGAVDRVSRAAGWGEVALSSDPYGITVRGIPARALSTSQALALHLSIQAAVAEASGIRVLVVDEAQTFESDTIEAVTRAIAACDGLVDQVMVLASRPQAFLDDYVAPEGWKYLRVSMIDGQSTVEAAP